MKKICIVSFCDLYILPYANLYIDMAKQKGAQCDLVYWCRDKENDSKNCYSDCNKIVFFSKSFESCNRIGKLRLYFEARKFICQALMFGDYDRVVFLQSHGAVLCSNVLLKKYRNRYIIDIRDYSLEHIKLYYHVESRLIKNAYASVISSPAYKKFLPEGDFYLAHNFNPFTQEELSFAKDKESCNQIRISYVGTVRFYDMDKKLLNHLANDPRYIVKYFGRGSEVLKKYCIESNINNVEFCGSFRQDQTIEFYKSTDLINNLYGNHCNDLDYALSNKLYHCIQLHIPILVCPDTYMAEVTEKYSLGFVLDINDPQSFEKLYNWFLNFDRKRFAKGCEDYLIQVQKDNERYNSMLNDFFELEV